MLFRFLHSILLLLNWRVTINGKKFKVPIVSNVGYNIKQYQTEEWMIPVLTRLLDTSTDRFIDVGANIGQTMLKLRSILPETGYIGVEPNPNCVSFLYKLIELNEFKDCQIIPVGLSNKTELMELFVDRKHDTDPSATLIQTFRDDNAQKSRRLVPVFSGEILIPYIDSNKIILKIDVEGTELEIMKGIEPVLDRYKPIIICEVLPIYSPSNTSRLTRQEQLEGILRSTGYRIFRIATGTQLLSLQTIDIHSNLEDVNYIFAHNSIVENLSRSFTIV